MRANRKRDTAPELALRRALHAKGYRYNVNRLIRTPNLRVRPDIVFPRRHVAVFIDGCFWHGCDLHGTHPRSNPAYWGPKLAANKARDARNTAALTVEGWRVVRIWEHEDVSVAIHYVEAALK
jgi:DNA mismatch endonuclease (patch repair protein)